MKIIRGLSLIFKYLCSIAMERKRIFIVEDDPVIASDLEGMLIDMGYNVCGVSHQPFDAKKKVEQLIPDLLLLDINLNSEIDGIDLATLIKNLNIGIVFISAFRFSNFILHNPQIL